MNKKVVISTLIIGILALASAFGVVAYRSANAASPTPVAPSDNGPAQGGFGKDFKDGNTNQDLATALGITVDQLSAAYQKADQVALAQAVQKGLITQAQADSITSKGSAFPFDGRWAGWLSQNGIDFNSLLADALGITVDKLQAATTQAYNARIDQEVTNGRLTQDQADLMKGQHALYANKSFQTSMQTAFEAAVKQAVTDGVITQAQADQILKSKTGMGFQGKGFGGFPGGGEFGGFEGPRGPGMHGGWGGGMPGGNPNNQAPVVPTATPSTGF